MHASRTRGKRIYIFVQFSFSIVCACLCEGAWVLWCACGGQMTTWGRWFSPSTCGSLGATQVIRLCSKHPYSINYLTSSGWAFKKNLLIQIYHTTYFDHIQTLPHFCLHLNLPLNPDFTASVNKWKLPSILNSTCTLGAREIISQQNVRGL